MHRHDVDQRNQVELGVLAAAQMVLRHAASRVLRQAHGASPTAMSVNSATRSAARASATFWTSARRSTGLRRGSAVGRQLRAADRVHHLDQVVVLDRRARAAPTRRSRPDGRASASSASSRQRRRGRTRRPPSGSPRSARCRWSARSPPRARSPRAGTSAPPAARRRSRSADRARRIVMRENTAVISRNVTSTVKMSIIGTSISSAGLRCAAPRALLRMTCVRLLLRRRPGSDARGGSGVCAPPGARVERRSGT